MILGLPFKAIISHLKDFIPLNVYTTLKVLISTQFCYISIITVELTHDIKRHK